MWPRVQNVTISLMVFTTIIDNVYCMLCKVCFYIPITYLILKLFKNKQSCARLGGINSMHRIAAP